MKRKQFYATMRSWDISHSHPLFLTSDNKHRVIFTTGTKRLLRPVLLATGLTIFLWAIHPFVDEGTVVTVPQAPSATTAMVAATELARPSTELVDLSISTLVTTQILSATTTETADFKLMNFTDVEPDLGVDGLPASLPEAAARKDEKVIKVTKLLINAWYPWNPYGSTFAFVLTYIYQVIVPYFIDLIYIYV
jgi:hypothetical protein